MAKTKQVAAIPIRRDAKGKLQVLLVTSRETRRWVVPKGWPWPDYPNHKAAAEEAWEEGGVRGKAGRKRIGTFTYAKRRPDEVVSVVVSVYLLEVDEVFATWPEAMQRRRAWFSPTKAANAVEEPELKELLLDLENSVA